MNNTNRAKENKESNANVRQRIFWTSMGRAFETTMIESPEGDKSYIFDKMSKNDAIALRRLFLKINHPDKNREVLDDEPSKLVSNWNELFAYLSDVLELFIEEVDPTYREEELL